MNSSIKTITQETFDGVVQENISDFDMDEAEAVDDAVQQFISQVGLFGLQYYIFTLFVAKESLTVH